MVRDRESSLAPTTQFHPNQMMFNVNQSSMGDFSSVHNQHMDRGANSSSQGGVLSHTDLKRQIDGLNR